MNDSLMAAVGYLATLGSEEASLIRRHRLASDAEDADDEVDDEQRRTGAALAAVPAVFWDAWLLSRFPGRTLEELEHVDILRLLRARVQMIEQVEELRKESRRSDTQSKLDTAADWAANRDTISCSERFED